MLSRTIASIVLTSLLCSTVLSAESAILHNYLTNKFPSILALSSEQIEQLSWVIEHKKRSFDLDMRANDEMHVEVSRALTRLYCLQLLKSGDKQSYERFVEAQIKNNTPDPLTFASFSVMADHIQQLSTEDFTLLQTAVILSAVSLSKPAAILAQRAMNLDEIANDNLNFLAATVRSEINIYPLTSSIWQDQVACRKLLYVLFPPQTNFRHMLYAEGGTGMYKYLRSMIQHQYITHVELDLWYAYWIVNIAGFRGHVEQSGSMYLNETVFKAMYKLKDNIYAILEQPNYDPLEPYLEYRATLLGLNNLSREQRLTLAHLGAMFRLYTPEEGSELLNGFRQLPKQLQHEFQQQYMQYLSDTTLPTPTHAPALFGNALQLTDKDIKQVIMKLLPVYHQALQLYQRDLKAQNLKPQIVLAFNKLSASYNVQKILQAKGKLKIKIQADGEVIIFSRDK